MDSFPPVICYSIHRDIRDLPGCFAVYVWTDQGAEIVPDSRPSGVARTVEQARRHVPPGLYWMGRDEDDPPEFVESWLTAEASVWWNERRSGGLAP